MHECCYISSVHKMQYLQKLQGAVMSPFVTPAAQQQELRFHPGFKHLECCKKLRIRPNIKIRSNSGNITRVQNLILTAAMWRSFRLFPLFLKIVLSLSYFTTVFPLIIQLNLSHIWDSAKFWHPPQCTDARFLRFNFTATSESQIWSCKRTLRSDRGRRFF